MQHTETEEVDNQNQHVSSVLFGQSAPPFNCACAPPLSPPQRYGRCRGGNRIDDIFAGSVAPEVVMTLTLNVIPG